MPFVPTKALKQALIGQHNISEKGLSVADEIGGLPNPSFAISGVENPLTKFGEISLIPDREDVMPGGAKRKVYSGDAYTSRQPRAEIHPDVPEKERNRLFKEGAAKYLGKHADDARIYMSEPFDGTTTEWSNLIAARSLGVNPDDYQTFHEFRDAAEQAIKDMPYSERRKFKIDDIYEEFGVPSKKRFFVGHTYSGKPRYKDYTLENLVKHMSNNAGEENFFYGMPSIRAENAPIFRTAKQVSDARDRVVSREQFEADKGVLEKKFDALLEKIAPLREGNPFSASEAAAQFISDVGRGRGQDWDFYDRVGDSTLDEIKSFVGELREMSTEYFEVKLKGAMPLENFKGAIVPEGASKETLEILKRRGIKDIQFYKTEDERKSLFKKFSDYAFIGAPVAIGLGSMTPEEAEAGALSKGIRAFHGSPHDFDKFSMDKIGSGEGAQAYGHGLYFAESESVAKAYRDNLGPSVKQHRVMTDAKTWAAQVAANIGKEGAITNLSKIAENGNKQAADAVKSLRDGSYKTADLSEGRMYEVNIKADPDDFLDWDAPLSEQPENIRNAYAKAAANGDPTLAELLDGSPEGLELVGLFPNSKGSQAYNNLRGAESESDGWTMVGGYKPGSAVDASEALLKSGIPGIKYRNAQTRASGEAEYNYVVFNNKSIEIIKKYGLAGAIASGLLTTTMTPDEAEAAIFGDAIQAGVPSALMRALPKGEPLLSEHDTPDPDIWDTTRAALQRENLIGSYASSDRINMGVSDFNRVDGEYNVFDDIEGYEDHEDRFLGVFNKEATNAIKADIDREIKNEQILNASGWTGVALSMGAAIADPTILVPGGAMVKSGRVGFAAGRSGLRVGAAAAGATAIQEAGLQATQETRTATESALNIGGSAILGGLLGAAGAKVFSKADADKFATALEAELAEEVVNPGEIAETIVGRMQSAGASSVDEIDISDLDFGTRGNVSSKIGEALAKATDSIALNPGVRVMLSPSAKSRALYNKVFDNPMYTQMNMEGKTLGASAENRVKLWQRGALASWMRDRDSLYKEATKSGLKIKKTEFNERVGRAMRRGDVDPDSEHISKAAKAAREKITDPLLKEAQSAKLLGEDVKTTTAESYFSRHWNKVRLEAEEGRFKQIAKDWVSKEFKRLKVADELAEEFISEADETGYIEEIVDNVFNNLTGRGGGDVPEWIVPTKRGPLKERTFKIPDRLIEEFLEDDVELVMRKHVRTMAAEVELANASKFGDPSLKGDLDEIKADYKALRQEVRNNKDLNKTDIEKQVRKLSKAEKDDIRNLEAFRDMLRGTYLMDREGTNFNRAARMALAWNYMRLLGGVTITSMADMVRQFGVHGIRNTMKEGFPELVRGLRGVSLSINEAKELGAVVETMLNSRLASLADLNDPYRYGSTFERMVDNTMTPLFTKLTGLTYWNDAMKGMASAMTQNRIMRNALKGGYSKLDEFEKSYMGFLGIDEFMAERIAGMYKKFGNKQGRTFVANTHKWTDKEAMKVYAAALNKDVDRTIVTKGVSDQPLWTRTDGGKIIAQFKSFALASHQRVLLAGLQERPHRMLEMLTFGTAIGMMIAYIKHMERGDLDAANALLDNPGLWISDGLDRTGLLSVPFEFSNTVEKIGVPYGFKSAAQALAGDDDRSRDVSRYASRNKLGAVLGPSAGLFQDLATIVEQTSKGDLKKSGANAIIRQLPGGSLPGAKTGLYVGARPALQELVE